MRSTRGVTPLGSSAVPEITSIVPSPDGTGFYLLGVDAQPIASSPSDDALATYALANGAHTVLRGYDLGLGDGGAR